MLDSSSELRRRLILERRALTPEDVIAREKKIIENFQSRFTQSIDSETVMALYRPGEPNRENEPNPCLLLDVPHFSIAHFAYPRVLDRFQGIMDFALAVVPGDWGTGVFGYPEPKHILPPVNPEDIDLVIVPGVVFGERGERMGRGAGFYDRYLNEARGALRVAFAYDFQVQSQQVPQEPWDAQMDWIITESRIIESHARG